MATVTELVSFLLPGLTLDAGALETAISVAEGYRPACLTTAKADEAVAAYAAWLLYRQVQSQATLATDAALLGVASEKLGDQQRDYRAASADSGAVDDPLGLYAQWQRLHSLCRGSITTSGRSPWPC